MPTLSRISVHPIKALDPVDRDRVGITDVGGLAGDRIRAIVDGNGGYVNGKRTAEVHRIRAEFSPELDRVSLGIRGERGDGNGEIDREFHVDDDREAMAAWLSDHLGIDVGIEAGAGGTLADGAVYGDGTKTGPTVVSEATLREVASWYEGIDPGGVRRRLRANLVVEGVPAFWEDRLYAGGGRQVRIGDVTLEGVGPVPRCVVPTRDPWTGAEYEGFRETFIERRRETLPEWTDPADLEGNFFSLTAATRIPESERDGVLEVGDPVTLVEGAVEN